MDSRYRTAIAQITGPARAQRRVGRQRGDLRAAERIGENDPPHWLSQGSYWRVEEERARVEFWAEIAALPRASQP